MTRVYKNAIITPYGLKSRLLTKHYLKRKYKLEGFPNCSFLSSGGVYDESGNLIEDSIRKGGFQGDHTISIAPKYIRTKANSFIAGKSAFIGNLFAHYGHFMTEGISRLYDFKNLNSYDELLMHPFSINGGSTILEPYHKWFFEKLGIDISKIKIICKKTRVESIVVYKQLWTINNEVDLSIKPAYQYIRDNSNSETINNKNIFLSVRNPQRIDNLRQIETVFEKQGYELVYPEELSLDDQIAIYRGNNNIVSLSGSSIHNIVFGGNKTRFIELGDSRTKNKPIIMQQLANKLSDSSYDFIKYNSTSKTSWNIAELQKAVATI